MPVGDALAAEAAARHPLVARVGRPFEQPLQGEQTARPAAGGLLAVDFLQAEHVGRQALELRAQHGDARLERRLRVRPVVQVLQVEGGDAQARAHAPVLPPCGRSGGRA